MSEFHSFLMLNSIAFYVYTSFHLCIHVLMDTGCFYFLATVKTASINTLAYKYQLESLLSIWGIYTQIFNYWWSLLSKTNLNKHFLMFKNLSIIKVSLHIELLTTKELFYFFHCIFWKTPVKSKSTTIYLWLKSTVYTYTYDIR